MTRRGKVLLFLPAALLLVLSLAMAWLLRSTGGAGFVWEQAGSRIAGELGAERISGSLSSGLVLHGLSYRDDSVVVTSPEVSLQLDIDLFPPALNLARLDISSLEVQLLASQPADATATLQETLTGLQLPYPVRFEALTLGELHVRDSDLAELFAARNLAAQALWHRKLEITRARLLALDGSWQMAGELQLHAPFQASGTVNLETAVEFDNTDRVPVQLQADFDGDLDRLATRLRSVQPGFEVEGELLDLLTEPGWKLEANAPELAWPLRTQASAATGGAAPQLALSDTSLSTQGTLSRWDMQLVTQFSGAGLPAGRLEVLGNGDGSGLEIDHLRFAGEELELSATGRLDWRTELMLTANTRIERLQPRQWLPDWPQANTLQGDVQLDISTELLRFSGLELEVAGTDSRLTGSGRYGFDSGELAADLGWLALAWPLDGKNPDFTSSNGQLQVQGKLDGWQAEGQLQLQAQDLPEGQLQLSAVGDANGVRLHIPRGQVLGGQFAGDVEYQWVEPRQWSADITAERISTTPLAPDFPGTLSGRVLAQGELSSPVLRFELRNVQGRIRQLDFSAQGRFSMDGSRLQADGLQLRSSSARLDLDGGMGPGQTLKFDARADELSQLWPGLAGRLDASGELSLDAQEPLLQIRLEADELHYGENHIRQIRTVQQADGSTAIQLRDASIAGREIPQLELQLDGSHRLQELQLNGEVDGTSLSSSLGGQLRSADGKRVNGWQGQVNSLRLSQPERGFLQLDQPAPVLLSTQRMELGPGCLRGTRDGRICLQGHWTDQGEAGLQTGVQQISLDIVRLFVDTDWAFTHRVDGQLEWSRVKGQTASAQANFSLGPGELLFEDESTSFSTGPGTFAFRISEGNLHSGTLHIPITGSGEIDMDFGVNRLLEGGAAELQANLKLQLRDLTPLQLLPFIDGAKGEISADLRVGGSLQDPQFTGHAVLVRGQLENQAIGLVLSEIQLAGAVYQYDHTELNGSFRAGDGRGRIKADLRFEDFLHPEFSLQLSGENLQLVDVPDMSLRADPDLDIRWADGQLRMNGKVKVPNAQLSPRYLPATTAVESPDLVIVAGQEETAVAAPAASPPLRITGEVEVELGPNVTLTLDRATANIQGKSIFTWHNNLVPLGDGAFRVSGEIYAYGQLLSISEGRVSFPNVPADNPHLNIKAEREIFGNSQIKRAGVLVSGTLKRPSLDPYTDPMSNRERALALLLTGSDFDYEQGVGAVEVGMYIAPKLFISYGIGLFEDQNVISARYDLGKGFGVKATSGQRETGVDISYTIEN